MCCRDSSLEDIDWSGQLLDTHTKLFRMNSCVLLSPDDPANDWTMKPKSWTTPQGPSYELVIVIVVEERERDVFECGQENNISYSKIMIRVNRR